MKLLKILLFGLIFILLFLDGGTSFLGEWLILILPLPLFLLAFSKNKIRLYSSCSVFFLAFLGFCFLSLLNSASLALSVPKFFQLLSFFLFFSLFLQVASEENLKFLNYTILAASFFLCLLSFYYLLPNTSPPKSTMNLVYSTHGHNHLAEYLCFALPISLALFIKSKRARPLFGILTIFYFLSLLFTFSRTSLLLLPLISFLMIRKLKPKKVSGKIISWLLAVLPIALLFFIFLLPLTNLGIQARKIKPYDWLVRQTIKPLKVEKRLSYWPQAIEAFLKRPFSGWGIGTFRLLSQRFQKRPVSWSWFAHNFYLQILCEAGIFAFLSFLTFLVVSLRQAWENIKATPFQIGSFFALLFSSFHSLFDFDWEFPAVFLTFFALLAFLVEKKNYSNKIKNISYFSLFLFLFLTFLFGSSRLLAEFYFQKKDYQKSTLIYSFDKEKWLSSAKFAFEKNRGLGEKIVSRAIFFNQEDKDFYFLLAEEFYKREENEKAAKMFQKVVSLDPLSPTAWQKLERIYERLGKEEKKIALYEELAEKIKFVEPESRFQIFYARSLYKLGLYFYEKGSLQKTEACWQEAARLAPQWSYFHLELADLYNYQGDFEKARKTLENCLQFYWPKEHCQGVLEREDWQEPGSWQEKILSISN
ncbi:MAG TPA: O-antigen ligase family protein [Nevskiaceae bacterium]|nr:O-antigen ligase family protein [Nevskiaceae bacterium]